MIDVDGVLINGRPSDGRHWSADLQDDLGLSFDVLQTLFFRRHWEEIVTGRADLRERLAVVLSETAPALSVDQLLDYWFRQDARLNQGLLREMATIRSGGLRAYLATNQEHERARYIMDALGLAAYVDGCCYSAAIGHRKPSQAFFDAVAISVGLRPDELLLIDDAAENIHAAIESGWHAARWTDGARLGEIVAKFYAVSAGASPNGAAGARNADGGGGRGPNRPPPRARARGADRGSAAAEEGRRGSRSASARNRHCRRPSPPAG
jgi:putative hydrolase of the HAD superfamily